MTKYPADSEVEKRTLFELSEHSKISKRLVKKRNRQLREIRENKDLRIKVIPAPHVYLTGRQRLTTTNPVPIPSTSSSVRLVIPKKPEKFAIPKIVRPPKEDTPPPPEIVRMFKSVNKSKPADIAAAMYHLKKMKAKNIHKEKMKEPITERRLLQLTLKTVKTYRNVYEKIQNVIIKLNHLRKTKRGLTFKENDYFRQLNKFREKLMKTTNRIVAYSEADRIRTQKQLSKLKLNMKYRDLTKFCDLFNRQGFRIYCYCNPGRRILL